MPSRNLLKSHPVRIDSKARAIRSLRAPSDRLPALRSSVSQKRGQYTWRGKQFTSSGEDTSEQSRKCEFCNSARTIQKLKFRNFLNSSCLHEVDFSFSRGSKNKPINFFKSDFFPSIFNRKVPLSFILYLDPTPQETQFNI